MTWEGTETNLETEPIMDGSQTRKKATRQKVDVLNPKEILKIAYFISNSGTSCKRNGHLQYPNAWGQ